MLRTLRRRLILGHILPLLVIIPLTGLALMYLLETQVVLVNLKSELTGQASLLAQLASDDPALWQDPAHAQAFVVRVSPRLTARVMMLDPRGQVLASSDPQDYDRLGQVLSLPALPGALAGQTQVNSGYDKQMRADVTDVLAPVQTPDQRLLGVVRLTYRLAPTYERLMRLRYLIAGILAAGLVLGGTVGWVLALNLERPLDEVTQAVYRLSSGEKLEPLTEQGPEEIKLLLRGVNTLVKRLQTLEGNRRQLLANLVHELGRPLGGLLSAIQALRGGADEIVPMRQELLIGMQEEVARLQRLLEDLARLRDQVVGRLELDRKPVELSSWLPIILATRWVAAQAKGLQWRVDIPPNLPAVEADPDRLAQALTNLINNAIKFTPPGGTITIDAGVAREQVWIQVSDTGPGIPIEEQSKIFVPFYRGRTGHRFPQGMGLGLTIARDLVVAHGGRIEVRSAPGSGSHFTIWLPITPPGKAARAASNQRPGPEPASQEPPAAETLQSSDSPLRP